MPWTRGLFPCSLLFPSIYTKNIVIRVPDQMMAKLGSGLNTRIRNQRYFDFFFSKFQRGKVGRIRNWGRIRFFRKCWKILVMLSAELWIRVDLTWLTCALISELPSNTSTMVQFSLRIFAMYTMPSNISTRVNFNRSPIALFLSLCFLQNKKNISFI